MALLCGFVPHRRTDAGRLPAAVRKDSATGGTKKRFDTPDAQDSIAFICSDAAPDLN